MLPETSAWGNDGVTGVFINTTLESHDSVKIPARLPPA